MTATASATLKDPLGLHARPCVALVKLAKSFAADIELAAGAGGAWVPAKSLMKVMKVKAPVGMALSFRADGPDAAAAVAALARL
ncbi:HPr family phosphocarrier protein, partial [Mycobacterium tuberculosis]|nr:HPr family phosphocarrier protein [Mycobacterium tuberculosis]